MYMSNNEITIKSMYVLTPMAVTYRVGDGPEECPTVFLIDFARERVFYGDGVAPDVNNPVVKKILEIVSEKKKAMLNPELPLESIEFALKNPDAMRKGAHVGH
jgi:hypothetical protein